MTTHCHTHGQCQSFCSFRKTLCPRTNYKLPIPNCEFALNFGVCNKGSDIFILTIDISPST